MIKKLREWIYGPDITIGRTPLHRLPYYDGAAWSDELGEYDEQTMRSIRRWMDAADDSGYAAGLATAEALARLAYRIDALEAELKERHNDGK